MATIKLGTYTIDHIDSDARTKAVDAYKAITDVKVAPSLAEKEFFCNFPFHVFGDKNSTLLNTLKTNILNKEFLKKTVSLYKIGAEDKTPVEVRGSGATDIVLPWDDSGDMLPINFVKAIFGGTDDYPLSKDVFGDAIKDHKAINEVTAHLSVSKTDFSIQLKYKIVPLYTSMQDAKNEAIASVELKDKKEVAASSAKVEIVINEYITNKMQATSQVTLIIASSSDAAQGIITGIAAGDVTDRSSETQGDTEKRGNFTITYY